MTLDADIREAYEERAAILQYEAGYPKEKCPKPWRWQRLRRGRRSATVSEMPNLRSAKEAHIAAKRPSTHGTNN